jgi:hypothetical protein
MLGLVLLFLLVPLFRRIFRIRFVSNGFSWEEIDDAIVSTRSFDSAYA